jgi:hypothetical protein
VLQRTVEAVLDGRIRSLPCMTMSTMVDPLNIESMEGEARRLFSVSGVCGERNAGQGISVMEG